MYWAFIFTCIIEVIPLIVELATGVPWTKVLTDFCISLATMFIAMETIVQVHEIGHNVALKRSFKNYPSKTFKVKSGWGKTMSDAWNYLSKPDYDKALYAGVIAASVYSLSIVAVSVACNQIGVTAGVLSALSVQLVYNCRIEKGSDFYYIGVEKVPKYDGDMNESKLKFNLWVIATALVVVGEIVAIFWLKHLGQ